MGEYSTILAKLQKKEMDKLRNPANVVLDPENILGYDERHNKEVYNKCKDNFKKAINILLYNNKAKESPEVMGLKNQLGELEYGEANY